MRPILPTIVGRVLAACPYVCSGIKIVPQAMIHRRAVRPHPHPQSRMTLYPFVESIAASQYMRGAEVPQQVITKDNVTVQSTASLIQ